MARTSCVVIIVDINWLRHIFFIAQGIISGLVSEIFGIEHGYYGSILSNLARLHMSDAVDESNEKHLAPWSDACTTSGVINTPLTPYIDQVS